MPVAEMTQSDLWWNRSLDRTKSRAALWNRLRTRRQRIFWQTLTNLNPVKWSRTTEFVRSSLTNDRSFRNAIPIFSPDGKRIAFNTQKTNRDRGEGDIWIINADGQNATQITTEGGGLASWFPDGKQLAFLSYRKPRTVWIANLETGQDKPLSLDFGEDVNYMRLSPDGKQVVFNSKRAGTTNVSKISMEGGESRQLTFDSEMIGYACWSPDGKTLGLQIKRGGDTHIGVMPGDRGPITQLTFDKGQSWLAGFSPDGDKLYSPVYAKAFGTFIGCRVPPKSKRN